MCNVGLLLGLLIAAEAALIAALIPLGIAVMSGTNPFTSAASPALVIAALVFLGVAQTAIGAALVACARCTGTGPCGLLGEALRTMLALIFASVSALVIAAITVVAPSAFPWVGSIAVAVVAVACAVIVPTVPAAATSLGNLETCLTGAARSTGATVALVLGVIVAIIAIPIAVSAGGYVLPGG